jgi:cytochrome c5
MIEKALVLTISRLFCLSSVILSTVVISDDNVPKNMADSIAPRSRVDTPTGSFSQPPAHPGQVVYEQHCAQCHNLAASNRSDSISQARSLETLGSMIPSIVERALVDGKMKAQASMLTGDEIKAVVAYVGGNTFKTVQWKGAAMCSAGRTEVGNSVSATVATFGFGYKHHRHLTKEQSGLWTNDFKDMELAWSLAFPNVTMMRAQPAIVGNALFVTPVVTQEVYAFNIETKPCLQRVYTADTALRTSLTYGVLPDSNRALLIFGDMSGFIRAIDAATGQAKTDFS